MHTFEIFENEEGRYHQGAKALRVEWHSVHVIVHYTCTLLVLMCCCSIVEKITAFMQ